MSILEGAFRRLVEFNESSEHAGVIELNKAAGIISSVGNRRYIVTPEQCQHLKAKNIQYREIKTS